MNGRFLDFIGMHGWGFGRNVMILLIVHRTLACAVLFLMFYWEYFSNLLHIHNIIMNSVIINNIYLFVLLIKNQYHHMQGFHYNQRQLYSVIHTSINRDHFERKSKINKLVQSLSLNLLPHQRITKKNFTLCCRSKFVLFSFINGLNRVKFKVIFLAVNWLNLFLLAQTLMKPAPSFNTVNFRFITFV